ncbi:inositol monophosphatase [Dehalococcoidia bacterium]|nr:inositol monophosphatase [Dehalococcoidia bacterium]
MMDNETLNKYLVIAGEVALLAGHYLSVHRENISIESQCGKDIKICVDREAECLILDALRDKAGFAILSEEKGLVRGTCESDDLRWIIDPLDGSLNFLRGIPNCCVSIGLWSGNKPVLGAIYDFNRKELFTGIVETGAWLNGNRIRVSKISAENEAVLFTGFPANTDYCSHALKDYVDQVRIFKKVRLIGSAALSLAYVAAGKADAYFERDIMLWDVAAGLAVLSGAGGKYCIRETSRSNTYEVYATNGFLEGILSEHKFTMP